MVEIEYTLPGLDGSARIARAWAAVPTVPTPEERAELKVRAAELLAANDAVLVAHFYVDGDLQDLALETGGCVADSLEMARFGRDHAAGTLVVAGVRFMGETAKILGPEKRVLVPDLDATCSLDLGCPPAAFGAFCDANPDRTVVVYANTSAAVKARADWMVTSSCALAIVRHLSEAGERILWAPDRHLGDYIARETGADMLMWDGACVVHDEFKGIELELLRAEHPGHGSSSTPSRRRASSPRRTSSGRRRSSSRRSSRGRRASTSSRPTTGSSTGCASSPPGRRSSRRRPRGAARRARAARTARGWR